MRGLAAILVALFCCTAAELSAQVARVETGEHANFSRVVIRMPRGTDWRLGRGDAGYLVELTGVDGFDTRGFFDLIPRDRITEVRAIGNRLALDLTCPCNAEAFVFRDNFLVIDIRDGLASPQSRFEARLTGEGSTAPITTAGSPRIALPQVAAPGIFPQIALPAVPVTPASPAPPLSIDAFSPLRELTQPDRRIQALESALLQELTRAATDGFLSLSAEGRAESVASEPSTDEARSMQLPEPPVPSERDSQAAPGILARSANDVGAALRPELSGLLAAGGCWEDRSVAVADWGSDAPFSAQIALRRADLTQEFDRIDQGAVEALAKTYLHFGLGREAILALGIDGEMNRDRAILVTLGHIMDAEQVTDPSLKAQLSCGGPAALWAILGSDTAPDDVPINRDEILEEFKLLPLHLQVHLGPRFADRLVRMSDPEAAQAVLRPAISTERPDVAAAEAGVALALDRGESVVAADMLAQMAETETRMTPAALAQLIDLQIAQDERVDPSVLELLETMRFEHRDTPTDAILAEAQIAATLHNQQPDTATTRLITDRDILPDAAFATLRDQALRAVTALSGDLAFLETAFTPLSEESAPQVQNAIADRLLALGFAERAAQLLALPAESGAFPERRYLQAEAAMALGDRISAEASLAGIMTPRADAILGGMPDIARSDDAAALQEALPDLAWRTGNWPALSETSDLLLRDVSQIVQAPDIAPLQPDAPLASGRALVEQARGTRDTLTELLGRFPAADPP